MDQTTLAAIVIVIPSAVTAVAAYYLRRGTQAVYREVRTLNESTMGQLAAAGETRRVDHIPAADRTAKEQRHVDADADAAHDEGV